MTPTYYIVCGDEKYHTDNIDAELLVMRCNGEMSIMPVEASKSLDGIKMIAMGNGGFIPMPEAMKLKRQAN